MVKLFENMPVVWQNTSDVPNRQFQCGYCSVNVSSIKGYSLVDQFNFGFVGGLYVCPNCTAPTLVDPQGKTHPSSAFGNPVQHVPTELNDLYEEARRCTSQNCYTASVLLCRKMLMNIAVAQGEKPGLAFVKYVEFLSNQGYVPPSGKHWVDHIRKKGNEATHEIALMTDVDAKELLTFTEMLLKFIYEFPALVSASP